ncbi:MFS transporter [Patulibacter defluvii]|uniref:MFS transporter n=1 Tax=Patulibacter defluvii TaxID=3095358 RepID=UPI002A75D47E|nr:MFS transporter [Patulibacter sp. DM4]
MRTYLEIIRLPHVGWLLACAMAVRLSPAMNSLAIVLLVADSSGSFALAGATTGAFALGNAIGAPLIGRLCDRRGLRLLIGIGALHAGLLAVLALAGTSSDSALVLTPLAFVAGGSYPPTGSALRSRWPVLVPRARLNAVYALDSVSSSVSFVSGPLFTAALVYLAEPAFALPLSGAVVAAGSALFVRALPAGSANPSPAGANGRRTLFGPLRWPGFRLLVVSSIAINFVTGTVEVGVAAFADDRGSPATAGLLIGLWSVSTALAGLAFGASRRQGPLDRTHRVAALGVLLTTVLVAAAGTPLTMALLLLLSGAAYSPMMVTGNRLVERLTTPAQRTEAYTWMVTSYVAGTAAGAAVSGAVVDYADWRTAVLAGGLVGAIGCAMLIGGRRLLAPGAAVDPTAVTGEIDVVAAAER